MTSIGMKDLLDKAIDESMTYSGYRALMGNLVDAGKTTGANQSDFYVKVTALNESRMKRLDRKATMSEGLSAALEKISKEWFILALTEAWCGDAAQILPVVNKVAEGNSKLKLRLILRDEHLELMDLFLTDGGRSIPKFLFVDSHSMEVVMEWGPRPSYAQEMAMEYKYMEEPKEDYNAFNTRLHTWYARDKTASTQAELTGLMERLGRIGASEG